MLNRLPTPIGEAMFAMPVARALQVVELCPDGSYENRPDSGSIFGLFFHLTSGADTYTVERVSSWLVDAGFGPAEKKTFRTLPSLAVVSAKAV